jgi:hypothetical protein
MKNVVHFKHASFDINVCKILNNDETILCRNRSLQKQCTPTPHV